jgi:hypothetical protein
MQKNEKVEVTHKEPYEFSELEVNGINSTIIHMIGLLKKYILLIQVQKELKTKPMQAQPVMRELYQYEEMKLIMDIRTMFDMVYAYTKNKQVITNFDKVRNSFEDAIYFITENMNKIKNIYDKNYEELLEEFSDKLRFIVETLTSVSIFKEEFQIKS